MGETTLKKALADYKAIYMPYRNFAQRTRVEYQNDLEDFINFLEQSGMKQVGELGTPIVERYAARLEERGYASLTRKRKVVAIRSFLSFLHQDGYIDTNIAKRIVLPFTDYPSPNVLTQAECNRLRDICANHARDRAIIELMLQTGITLSEVVRLTLDDIQLEGEEDQGFMRILGSRGKKERLIPLNTKASFVLKNYLDERKDAGNGRVFLSRFDEPLGESGVQKMLRKYFQRMGLQKASAHSLRHTFAIHQLAQGTDASKIQSLMGYQDPRSMQSYIYLARELIDKHVQNNVI